MFSKRKTLRNATDGTRGGPAWSWPVALLVSAAFCPLCFGANNPAGAHFRKQVQPILVQYCYDCHGDGMDKGKVAFDEFKSDEELLGKRDLWWEVLKNLRAGIMPPERKPRPSAEERRRLETWIKQDVFGIDSKNPDPGRVTIRRLNRVEYRNTIRELMGTEFRTDEEFPPDDTGYGFDNIGDVLTMSPLLLEKYMQAAESIVATAVPTAAKVVPEKTVAGREFRASEGSVNGEVLSFYNEAKVSHTVKVENAGDYRLFVELNVRGAFDFDPGKCRLVVKADDQGSVEALAKSLTDLPSDKVKIKIVHAGSGAITETDIHLASASNAIVIGYNVRPERSAQELAEKEKVDLRLHSVIYDITNEIKNAMLGLLDPESKEVYLGRAEVRQVFKVPKVGTVAGSHVSDGKITRSAEVRLLRDNVVVYTGKVSSLRRFKDDASEVKAGYECGIGLANFNDVKVGDIVEAFKIEKIAVKNL